MAHDDQKPESTSIDDEREKKNTDATAMSIRRELALILVGFIVVVALIAVVQTGAMPILDKFLPAIMLVLGFFFGQKSNQL
jgi:hypothetical protein